MDVATGFENLRLKYPGEDGLLFQGLSLSIKKGTKTLLLGPSGCGKSTLLQALSGLVPNSIELPMKHDGITVPQHSGYVFQDPDTQFCMPYVDEELAFVLENLKVPRAEMPAAILALLELVGLQLGDAHTLIGTISQGMKQRLAIASALALKPEVLFLDEPTALLDPGGTRQVWDTIKRNAAGKTIVIVEHKINEVLDWVDRILVMGPDGSWIADGTPSDVFASCRDLLTEYGIWHPGVWEEHRRKLRCEESGYIVDLAPDSKEALRTASDSGSAIGPRDASKSAASGSLPRLALEHFRGRRGGEIKIEVERAIVKPGEWVAVTGANGAGKSSLLLGIMGLIKTEGHRKVENLLNGKVEQVAELAAFVFQNPELQFIAGTVEEEISFSIPRDRVHSREREQRITETLERFQLLPYRKRHPYQLSMGQKRRLSVAAAMERGQQLLLLDEPTFGLDASNTFALLDKLEELRRSGTSIVMVTHDEDIVRDYAAVIWHVEKGKIAEFTQIERSWIKEDTRPC
ncbi:ABC transporter ATP-binding protein [Paenibacillus sp. CAU 1782]